jgi:hypothetical protein
MLAAADMESQRIFANIRERERSPHPMARLRFDPSAFA